MDEVLTTEVKIGQKRDNLNEKKVPKLNEACKEDHGDEDDHGGIYEFLVFLQSLDFGIRLPWPTRFMEFTFYFT